MTVKKDTSTLAQQVEDLTETLNRVVSLITGNIVVNLDPSGELQMTREEYVAHWEKINAVSAEHDARKKQITSMSSSEIEKMIEELEGAQLSAALSGLAT
jgi:hypothetical protein|tara:strand:+ start:231 stop:530 length:300 start_codon:yes stop_codon:yes gene_type:complete